MYLETGSGLKIDDPSASQIADELASLPGGTDSFAILSQDDDLHYMQTADNPSGGFVLEYHDGSLDQHYRATDNNLPLAVVTNAFQLYAAKDSSWRTVVAWEHHDLSPSASGFPLLPAALVAAAILGLVLWRWRAA